MTGLPSTRTGTLSALLLGLAAAVGCGSQYHDAAKEWALNPQARLALRLRQAAAAQDQAVDAVGRALAAAQEDPNAGSTANERARVAMLDFARCIASVGDVLDMGAAASAPADPRASASAARFEAIHAQLSAAMDHLEQPSDGAAAAAQHAYTLAVDLAHAPQPQVANISR